MQRWQLSRWTKRGPGASQVTCRDTTTSDCDPEAGGAYGTATHLVTTLTSAELTRLRLFGSELGDQDMVFTELMLQEREAVSKT